MSQHSSSVPSTPLQHPRDIRFPSRSPSPSRGLGSQSPRSVASEAIGTQPVSRGGPGPGVCRFESGAEFRKRRIPYTEGGSDPLPAPETEPKKALEPNEDDRLSGDMRELYDRLLPSEESEERRVKLVEKLENILNEEWPGNDIKVNVFGSSGNLLSSTDSDVDVCITTPFRALESMHSLATVLHKHGMEKVVCRASAKVPIVKIWDPELELACDMNVNNPSALENTRMIKTYVQMDERVRPLAKIIKYWTKQRILNDAAFGGTISSYTWICMIINFLQLRSPPILPSLQKIPDVPRSTINGKPSPFADDLESLKDFGKANTESLGQLLFHFFRYYGYEMDYGEYVVSVKEGRLLTRKEKGWDSANYHDKEARSRLCVEEPFNTIRNLGNSADEYAFSGIHKEIRRAFDLIANGMNLPDYFGTAAAGMSQDQLHNQLYKQYQYLQAQQEVLRNQLVQQQQTQAAQMQAQAQAQAQARSQDPTASPRQRPFANSLPSPRILENPPNTAPLIPGYLYHYPARYPAPSSPLSQSRSVEATATNPSSPSLATSVPSLRRSVHRSSFTEASSNASVRSQSQPGRSFPNPLTLQGMVHPGFDVSGAIGTPYLAQRNMQMYSPMRTNASIAATANSTQQPGIESAIPKDYVGYYVGQSPQLTPQYPPGGIAQTPPYREPPQAPRRLSPKDCYQMGYGISHGRLRHWATDVVFPSLETRDLLRFRRCLSYSQTCR
ncbi:hypothetical protein H2203_009225 [Taxawa tesnikishii (nom. ined.)]|nr:hypothetical protein H2203_009225 [Dothideales sp. JES 119]